MAIIISRLQGAFHAFLEIIVKLFLDASFATIKFSTMNKAHFPTSCGKMGLVHRAELYCGKTRIEKKFDNDFEKDSAVVMRLAEAIPDGKFNRLYAPNYFNSSKLQVALVQKDVYMLGTLRLNRAHGLSLKNYQNHQGQFKNNNGIRLAAVLWHDNKPGQHCSALSLVANRFISNKGMIYTPRGRPRKKARNGNTCTGGIIITTESNAIKQWWSLA